MTNQISIEKTKIEGLLIIKQPVYKDERGWFKEGWQREKMTALGLPDFKPVQCNVSYNHKKGVVRGIHAEPWDKYVFIANGEVFVAIVDLRPGESFGEVVTTILNPEIGLFIPEGLGNSYQTTTDQVVYNYLVTAHWQADLKYKSVHPFDPDLAIAWPISEKDSLLSAKDAANLPLKMLKDD